MNNQIDKPVVYRCDRKESYISKLAPSFVAKADVIAITHP